MIERSSLLIAVSTGLLLLTACESAPTIDAGSDAASMCAVDPDCDDNLFCNGEERCAPDDEEADSRGCAPALAPPCESERCDDVTDRCEGAPCADVDGDGARAASCGGNDCDDANPLRYPGALELCDDDDVDEDCDSRTFGFLDLDGDGYSGSVCCNGAGEERTCGADCDAERPSVHPTATEACDALDNDCDGAIDEGVMRTFHRDADGDGFGDPSAASETGCAPPAGFVEDARDCDDTVQARNPGAPETCDGLDNDCDTVVDESIGRTFYRDQDHDGFGLADSTVEACSRPADYSDRPGDCDDAAPTRSPVLPEVCDGVDNDCDGVIDDSATSTSWYRDADGDGHGDLGDAASSCAPLTGRVLLSGDCDDGDRSRNPAAPEVCDDIDNDCDALVDDGVAQPFYRDTDGDGFGVATELLTACSRPANYSPLPGDCDDTSRQRSPGLPEFCDGIDNDCDGTIDDGIAPPLWYRDADADGYGLVADTRESCARPSGYTDVAGDCDDTLRSRNPAAPEACDGVDNDCDLVVDDGVLQTFYRDADSDGYGTMAIAAPSATTRACGQPVGYAVASTDCDDTRASRNPGAPEVCDGVDNDCNGLLDYPGEDPDGDGHTIAACGGADCDNARADVYPGAPERCDGLDNDCDGILSMSEDADGDQRARIACGGADCDDTDPSVFPGNVEACDGLDNDCDNLFDGPGEDVDGDRYISMVCGGTDCDDTRATIHPGIAERCDAVDTDCDGALMPGEDDDGDGVADVSCGGTDCDDNRASVRPGADEGCDGLDTDCVGGLGVGEDADRDGVARASCGVSCVGVCGDCDDVRAEVRPGATELCDGRDDDCDGQLDGPGEDDDGDGYADVACGAACTGSCADCDDTRNFVHPSPPPRDCDGFDNDCDGITDEIEGVFGQAYPALGAAEMSNRIAVNGTTATLIAADVTAGSRNIVLAQFSTVDGSVVTPRRFLTMGIANEDQPRISVAGSGYVIVYLSDVSGVDAVHWARLDAAGAIVAGPVAISSGTSASAPSIAAGGVTADRAIVVFAQGSVARRVIVRSSDGAILVPTADLNPVAALLQTEAVWDVTSARFGVLVSSRDGVTTLTLHRIDPSGVLVGTDDVGRAYIEGYAHIAAASGRFLLSRWNGEAGPTLRYWSSSTGAVSAETVVPAPLGGLPYGQMMGISPTNVWVGWNGGLSVRRQSDLGPYTGAFASSMVHYAPGSMVWADGLMVGSTTHNGDTVSITMSTCR